jgi:hypothetical protein
VVASCELVWLAATASRTVAPRAGSVFSDPGTVLGLAFADQGLADDAHSGFVPYTDELASIEVVGEGVRVARG